MSIKISVKILLTALVLFTICSLGNSIVTPKPLKSYAATTFTWGYRGAGNPQNWGTFAPTCSIGKNQSPINLTNNNSQDLSNIFFEYQPSKVHILNNGRTVRVNYDRGSYIKIANKSYELKQFHYHCPSEHSVKGKLFSAELHLVHEEEGKYAVVGILLEEGAENLAYKTFIDHLPTTESGAINLEITLNAAELLPTNQATYRYQGSLTTPPCTEGINWLLMTTPVELSKTQINALKNVFNGNNRPLQSIGTRQVIQDSTP